MVGSDILGTDPNKGSSLEKWDFSGIFWGQKVFMEENIIEKHFPSVLSLLPANLPPTACP
jgi:hypothetical protein